jgi:hypothetical protein
MGYASSIFGFQAVFTAMWCIFAIVGLKRLLKRMWLVGIASAVAFTLIAGRDIFIGAPGHMWLNVIVALLVLSVLTIVAVRVGLLATSACFVASFLISATPWTFDPGAWYFPPSASALLLLCGLAAFAGYSAAGVKNDIGPRLQATGFRRVS